MSSTTNQFSLGRDLPSALTNDERDKMSDIVERFRAYSEDGWPMLHEAADEIERLRELKTPASRELLNITKGCLDNAEAEIEQLRAERDNWEAVCSGSLKEQFRLARENEARLKLALEQLDKAAAEIEMHERLRATLADALETLRAEKRELRAEIARLMEAKWQE